MGCLMSYKSAATGVETSPGRFSKGMLSTPYSKPDGMGTPYFLYIDAEVSLFIPRTPTHLCSELLLEEDLLHAFPSPRPTFPQLGGALQVS